MDASPAALDLAALCNKPSLRTGHVWLKHGSLTHLCTVPVILLLVLLLRLPRWLILIVCLWVFLYGKDAKYHSQVLMPETVLLVSRC